MSERSELIMNKLGMKHLNVEEGLFSLVTESAIRVTSDGQTLAASNMIYLMLNRDEPLNYLQWLESDDYQILIEGGPADYYLFFDDGSSEKVTMGSDISNGEQFVVAAPGCTAKAIVLHDEAEFLLCASVVTPAWTPTRTVIGADEQFVKKFAGSAEWATEEKIRDLIGPNFGRPMGGRTKDLELAIDKTDQIIFQGMQLSVTQMIAEFERFSALPDHGAAILTAPRTASAAVTEAIIDAAESFDVTLERIESPEAGA